jgi:hypothetical protein
LKSSARRAAVFSVALVLLLCFQGVVMAETETETRTQTATLSSGIQQYLSFSMVPPSGSSLAGYHYGSGSARVQPQGTFLSVHFNAEGVAVWDLLEGVSNGGGQQVVTLLQSATTQQSTSPVGTQRTTQAVPAGYVFVTGLAGLSEVFGLQPPHWRPLASTQPQRTVEGLRRHVHPRALHRPIPSLPDLLSLPRRCLRPVQRECDLRTSAHTPPRV